MNAGDLSGDLIPDAHMPGQLAEVRRELPRQIFLASLKQTDLQVAFLASRGIADFGAGKLGCRHRPTVAAAYDHNVEGL